MTQLPQGVTLTADKPESAQGIFTTEALEFIASLHRALNPTRQALLERRRSRQASFDAGETPDFLEDTKEIRGGDWQVAKTPEDLQNRRVEITGPVERKMLINALNSGADVFMADFEDALSPSWLNVANGQFDLFEAVRKTIRLEDSARGKTYELGDDPATLLVRPRGWHLVEKHVHIDGEPISASLFDFGLYFFHNATELLARGSGPYYYLPKLESHLEARLWNDAFNLAQDTLGIPRGTIRATVLIETILAAFEMEEIVYELREHMAGLNAGRWDYIFSLIKTFRTRSDMLLPDRAQVTMAVPLMRSYAELVVKSCHTHGAHAIGGMAAFIPNRRDPEVTEQALAKVTEDKTREADQGFDGTWVAHPDLVPVAREAFDAVLGDKPHQKERRREDLTVTAQELLDTDIEGGKISEEGVRLNVSVALQYLNAWLLGNGAAAIYNLMEDTATAEISRAQLWQWLHNEAALEDGGTFDQAMYDRVRDEELASLGGPDEGRYREAAEILDKLVLTGEFIEFLTLIAYDYLD